MSDSTGGPESGARAETNNPRFRHIRSFVRREGRMTSGQERALRCHLTRYSVPDDVILNLPTIFGRQAPLYLEIGSGNGECIASLARAFPANNYLAVEVHRPGIGQLLNRVVEWSLDNLRVATDDVHTLLPRLMPETVSVVYVFFPDPWPKTRHHKRRLLQPEFFAALQPHLSRHGRVHIATDSSDYAEHIQNVVGSQPGWTNLARPSGTSPRLKMRPMTRFETRGVTAGRLIHDFTVARC